MITLSPQIENLIKLRQTLYLASCWEILRTDSVAFRYTDHDQSILLSGNTYTPNGALRSSARQKQAGLRKANIEIVGVIDADEIDHQDLVAGRFRDAQVTEYLVDHRHPWVGPLMQARFWVGDLQYDHERWTAELTGIASFLDKPIGSVFGRTCRHTLGDAGCTVDIDAHTYHLSDKPVLEITGVNQFRLNQPGPVPNGTWTFGHLVWKTGNNAGLTSEIKTHLNSGGPNNWITLGIPTPWAIEVGDTFDIWPGCNKTLNECVTKFNNLTYFGGFVTLPGSDKPQQSPGVMNRDATYWDKIRQMVRGV